MDQDSAELQAVWTEESAREFGIVHGISLVGRSSLCWFVIMVIVAREVTKLRMWKLERCITINSVKHGERADHGSI